MLFCVSKDNVPVSWQYVHDLLEPAAERSDGDYTIDDIYHELMNGTMQLLVWQTKEKITAACVIKIIVKKHKKICTMPLIGGKDMEEWLKVEDQLVEYARQQGCTQLEGYCRDGWLRVLKKWKKVWTTMRRDI